LLSYQLLASDSYDYRRTPPTFIDDLHQSGLWLKLGRCAVIGLTKENDRSGMTNAAENQSFESGGPDRRGSVTKIKWIPRRPDGCVLGWLMADSEQEAWDKLVVDEEYTPNNGVTGFKARGFEVNQYEVDG
jgi:hypothetical protein